MESYKLVALAPNGSRYLLGTLSREHANMPTVTTLDGQAIQIPVEFPGFPGLVMDDEAFGLGPYLLMKGGAVRRRPNALGPGVAKGVE